VERVTSKQPLELADGVLPRPVELDVLDLLGGLELGLFAARRPLALATAMPSRVRLRARFTSNSAIIERVENSSRPTGSVGRAYSIDVEPDAPVGSSSKVSRTSGVDAERTHRRPLGGEVLGGGGNPGVADLEFGHCQSLSRLASRQRENTPNRSYGNA
jgi:hypothetical protein